jgi:CHAT domain-containing protein
LVGYPEYNLSRDKQEETARKISGKIIDKESKYAPALYTDKHMQIEKKEYAGGVSFTIEELSAFLKQKKIKFIEYTGADASEEVIKEAKSPKFLHIGTHGFFFGEKEVRSDIGFIGTEQQRYFQNPLHLSGLYLAGANESIRRTPCYEGMDDGILTAYEVMNLNLDNTELVVLQACETGLGNVKNGEGVYGLQRAFLTAGAKSVLMSLWKVRDGATVEFMEQFYQLWLDGKDLRTAYKKAVEFMKVKYQFPYYWGAFVLVGE